MQTCLAVCPSQRCMPHDVQDDDNFCTHVTSNASHDVQDDDNFCTHVTSNASHDMQDDDNFCTHVTSNASVHHHFVLSWDQPMTVHT